MFIVFTIQIIPQVFANTLLYYSSKAFWPSHYDTLSALCHGTHARVFTFIPETCPKAVQMSNKRRRKFPKICKDARRLPKIGTDFRGRPEHVSIIHQQINAQFKRQNSSEIFDILTIGLVMILKIRHSSPGVSFVWILRVVYFPVKHSRQYNKRTYFKKLGSLNLL